MDCRICKNYAAQAAANLAMKLAAATAAVMCVSCDSISIIPGQGGKDVIPDPRNEEFLCCAVTFPQGYNWHRDSLAGNVPVSLEVYLNDKLVRSIPVLSENGVCTDSDRHVLCGSHILSHSRHLGATLVSLDGEVMQKYQSDETIRSMLLHGGDIYTLSDDVRQMTWSFRVNGEVRASGNNSLPGHGGLYIDCGQVCFAYKVTGQAGSAGEYHFVHGTIDEVVFKDDGQQSLMALHQVDGQLNILAGDKSGIMVWTDGQKTTNLYISPKDVGLAEFAQVESRSVLHIGMKEGKTWREIILDRGVADMSIPKGWHIYGIAGNARALYCACCPDGSISPVMLHENGRDNLLEDYMMVCPTAFKVSSSGTAYVGVNRKDLRPEVIRGADALSYDFNGYVTYISLP